MTDKGTRIHLRARNTTIPTVEIAEHVGDDDTAGKANLLRAYACGVDELVANRVVDRVEARQCARSRSWRGRRGACRRRGCGRRGRRRRRARTCLRGVWEDLVGRTCERRARAAVAGGRIVERTARCHHRPVADAHTEHFAADRRWWRCWRRRRCWCCLTTAKQYSCIGVVRK